MEQARYIARVNYEAERACNPALPVISDWPDMRAFAGNRLGVSAFDGGEMLGFLCSVPPFKNAFHSTDATGVFSPMHANGAVARARALIYARLYEAAGEKWAKAGAASHAVCLYAHDEEGQRQFFEYGFGIRCMDAIRDADDEIKSGCQGYCFRESKRDLWPRLLPLDNALSAHYASSPGFFIRKPKTETEFIWQAQASNSRFFTAEKDDEIVAFLRAEPDGETFIGERPDYMHVTGAYCLPEHRGKGVNASLLSYAVHVLRREGYARLGVDFESINPVAHHFWRKHFGIYTHGLVRRIDEYAVRALSCDLY
jgi:GNAT superfamily N-acetyltransferase